MLSNFRVYQASIEFYQGCRKLSLPSELKDQLNRASSSVSLNLAEGYGRISKGDKKRFYRIALGSLREGGAVFDLAGVRDPSLLALADYMGGGIYKLITRSP